jgi:hypothetical protein
VGNELACTLRHAGKSFAGKALLETSEILFRGETRLKIAFSAILSIGAKDGALHVRTKEGPAVFELGPQADKWCEKIKNPKSVIEKLGVTRGHSACLVGAFSTDFVASLKKHGVDVNRGKPTKGSPWIFFAADERGNLGRLPSVARSICGATALWMVYPKGQKSITENDVRSAGLKMGLVDIKVVSFSATHTALKFVLPKAKS